MLASSLKKNIRFEMLSLLLAGKSVAECFANPADLLPLDGVL